jgi:hypothetical protein
MASGLPVLPPSVNVFLNVAVLVADAVSLPGQAPQQWGLFLDGDPVVVSDNVMAFGFKKQARVSKYPQESGAFASYNKVSIPGEPRLRFSSGGSVLNRQALLASITPLISDTNLYDVVMPEMVFSSYNVTNFDFDRDAEKAGLLEIDVWLEEIVVAGASTFSNTSQPSDSSQVNNGLVQPGASVPVDTTPGFQ